MIKQITISGTTHDINLPIPRATTHIKTSLAKNLPNDTEAVYFCGSDGTATGIGFPETYCIANIKKGNNRRTLIDCYGLNTQNHYTCGNLDADNDSGWSDWVKQPGPGDIPTKVSQLTNDAGYLKTAPVTSVAGKTGAVTLAKSDVGLGSVVNTGDSATPVSGGTTKFTTGGAYAELAKKVNTSSVGAANGVASLDANGKVPTAQLPSYVDDVLEYSAKSSFPTTGETGKIYVDTSTNITYRWSGSAYVEISASLALGETSSTAYRGDRGKTAYDHASAKGSAFASGLYKITTNAQGHVTAATAVTKADITNLLGFTPLTSAEIDAKINAAITSAIAASY